MSRLRVVGGSLAVVGVLALLGLGVAGFFAPDGADEGAARGSVEGERLRVEVLNAAGVPGLARTVTARLRERNFDVVYFGNASGGLRDSSAVLDRVGRPAEARRVAEALGIGTVLTEPDSTLYLEATVLIGRDWQAIGENDEEAPLRP